MVNGENHDAANTITKPPVGATGLSTGPSASFLSFATASQEPHVSSSTQPLRQHPVSFSGYNDSEVSVRGPEDPAPASARPSSSPSPSAPASSPPPTFHFLAGLCTGSLSAFLLQPADLLKTRVQQARGLSVTAALREILSQPSVLRQLWRGTLPSVIRTGFGSALYFASLNILRSSWPSRGKDESAGSAMSRVVRTENSLHSTAERKSLVESSNKDMRSELARVSHLAIAERGCTERAKVPGGTLTGAEMPSGRTRSVPGPALDSTVSVHTPPPSEGAKSSTLASQPQSSFSSTLPKRSNTANLITGALARAGAGFIMMPITVLKVRYESSLYASYGTSTGLIGATRAIVSREGIRGLYAGYGATLARDAPHAGLYVVFYEQAKAVLARISPPPVPSENGKGTSTGAGGLAAARSNFAAGVVAAAAATAVTNPFDTVKTRIQLMPDRYANSVAAVATILRHEGPRALFDGLALRMARKALSSALAWTIYEDLVRRAEIRYADVAAVPNAAGRAAT